MNWEDIIKNYPNDLGRHTKIFHNKLGDTAGTRAIDLASAALNKLREYKQEVLDTVNPEDRAEASKVLDEGMRAMNKMMNYFLNYYPDSQREIDEAD